MEAGKIRQVINRDCNQGHRGPGIPVLKTQNSPRQRKNSRKFQFAKMLDFARSNTISTQISNIYLKQLQWCGQFALAEV